MPPPAARPPRGALRNWRVRSRLLLLVAIPTLTAVVLGGFRVASSLQSALTYQRVHQLATLASRTTALAQALENERDFTVAYIGLPPGQGGRADALAHKSDAAAQLHVVQQYYGYTDTAKSQVERLLPGIGDSFPVQVQQEAQSIQAALAGLGDLRRAAVSTQLPPLVVISKYAAVINTVLAINGNIALNSGDATLTSDVRALGLVSQIKEEASQQRAILAAAFEAEQFGPGMLSALNAELADQNSSVQQFNTSATVAQRALYNSTVSGSLVDRANSQEQQAIAQASVAKNESLAADPTTAVDWLGSMSNGPIARLRAVEQQFVAQATARASALRSSAILFTVLTGAAVIAVLVLALLFTTIVGRSMVRPLRRLRAGALEVAGLRLPETVRRMSESDGEGVPLDVEPIDVESSDEIGEVARAFDQVHREAIRLAANEAALRGNVNAMFVNLSRRSQSLVERQIRLIDELEQGEQDPEQLASLFQMDHLATRMRRNSENLLVLAGHEVTKRWNQPVALVDVLRAAVSEIEQYERVQLNVQPALAVRGQAVNDVVHLLAELAENATSFSSADTPVTISGHVLTSGGVLVDITDQGVGMSTEEMAHANWRLDNPPVVDVAVSRRMGLFVVARLAARHGIRVRLRPAASGGLTALVWLPDEVVTTQETVGGLPSRAEAVSLAGQPDGSGSDATTGPFPALVTAAGVAGSVGGVAGSAGGAAAQADWRALGGSGAPTGPLPAFRAEDRPGGHARQDDGGQPGQGPAGEPEPPPEEAPRDTGADALDMFASGSGNPFTDMPGGEPGTEVPQPGTAETETAATGEWPAAGESWETSSRAPQPWGTAGQPSGAAAGTLGAGETAGAGEMPGAGETGRPEAGGPDESRPEEQPAGEPAAGEPAAGEPVAAGAAPVLGAPVSEAATGRDGAGSLTFSWEKPDGQSAVIIPPVSPAATENRLPIFEAVESDWFRRGRQSVSLSAPVRGADGPREAPLCDWQSPADEGWRAAEAAQEPAAGGVTAAGLPKRVPKANLVPGAAPSGGPQDAQLPLRSAAVTRERFASFQRGIREGRAAASSGDAGSGPDDGDEEG
jgi:signal transduction histidine kinase